MVRGLFKGWRNVDWIAIDGRDICTNYVNAGGPKDDQLFTSALLAINHWHIMIRGCRQRRGPAITRRRADRGRERFAKFSD